MVQKKIYFLFYLGNFTLYDVNMKYLQRHISTANGGSWS